MFEELKYESSMGDIARCLVAVETRYYKRGNRFVEQRSLYELKRASTISISDMVETWGDGSAPINMHEVPDGHYELVFVGGWSHDMHELKLIPTEGKWR